MTCRFLRKYWRKKTGENQPAENYDEVYMMMKSLGSGSDILTKEAYREWPIFKEIRKQENFKNVFEMIFAEKLILQNVSNSMESSIKCKDEISSGEIES